MKTGSCTRYAETSLKPMLHAIDSFNSVYNDYKIETTLILLVNAWELLAKSILIKNGKSIYKTDTRSFSCEESLNKLSDDKHLDKNQIVLLQQIVSLRNSCVHSILPFVPEEVQHHLFFFSCKFYKDLIIKNYPGLSKKINKNFLTLSFDKLTTYAAVVQPIVSKLKKGTNEDKELIWLLERGIRYVDSNKYISQEEFESLYANKKKIAPYLELSKFIENADMVTIFPVQAPKNHTADIVLRKGAKNLKGTLPVTLSKTDPNKDYPYLTSTLAKKLNKHHSFVAKMIRKMGLFNDMEYHLSVETGKKSSIQRYSDKALSCLKDELRKNPDFNPYK